MSKLDSEDGLYLKVSELLRFLSGRLSNPDQMSKLEWELFAGVLLSRFLFSPIDSDVLVGVPVDPDETPLDPIVGFTLADLLTRPDLRRDMDIDIVIRHSGTPVKFQLARVVREDLGRGRKTFEDILSRKIEKQPPDSKLFLAILIEENTSVAETLLLSLIRPRIPFGGIFLLGKMNQIPGEFHCQMVFPERKHFPSVHLPIGL